MRMMLIVGTVAAALCSTAMAQQPKEFDFKLNEIEINVIADALGELPYKKASPVFTKLQQQINVQLQPKPAVQPEAKTEEKKPE